MGNIDLKKNEVILKRDSNILHDRGRKRDGWGDELVLTNKALIVVHKGMFSSEQERYSLGRVRVVNGIPQVTTGIDRNGRCCLNVFFPEGVEFFTLGDADDDSEFSLRNIFTPESEKERQNLEGWRDAIASAVLRFRTEYEAEQAKAAKKPKKLAPPQAEDVVVPVAAAAVSSRPSSLASSETESVRNSASASNSSHDAAAKESSHSQQGTTSTHATKRCIGCMAPITGIVGEKTTCRYCDTVQVIS